MRRVLIISYYWPPSGGSGVQRWVKFAKYLPEMRKNIASILEIDVEDVGIAAMTNEGMDAVGQGKAIRANAVCLLERK